MNCNPEILNLNYSPIVFLIIFLVIWDFTWKALAMWKSARNNDLVWFVCIALINTLGILPIVYILLDRKKGLKESKEEKQAL